MCLDFGGKKNDFLIHFGVFYSVRGELKYALYTEYKESTKLIFFSTVLELSRWRKWLCLRFCKFSIWKLIFQPENFGLQLSYYIIKQVSNKPSSLRNSYNIRHSWPCNLSVYVYHIPSERGYCKSYMMIHDALVTADGSPQN